MINKIEFCHEDSVFCKSRFYTCCDILYKRKPFCFLQGVNKLVGDIDDGNFAVSYLLSMYDKINKKHMFYSQPDLKVNDEETSLKELTKYCCYLDEREYPLFKSKRKTVRQLIEKGLKKSGIKKTCQEICDLFLLTDCRLDRPIYAVGNERFRSMAAVGYAHGKEVFCFPWLSKKMFNYYTNNILWLLDILEELKVIAIVPVGK